MNPDELPPLCKPKDVARYLDVSIQTVMRYCDDWGLRRVRCRTRSVWFHRSSVLKAFPTGEHPPHRRD